MPCHLEKCLVNRPRTESSFWALCVFLFLTGVLIVTEYILYSRDQSFREMATVFLCGAALIGLDIGVFFRQQSSIIQSSWSDFNGTNKDIGAICESLWKSRNYLKYVLQDEELWKIAYVFQVYGMDISIKRWRKKFVTQLFVDTYTLGSKKKLKKELQETLDATYAALHLLVAKRGNKDIPRNVFVLMSLETKKIVVK